MRLQGMNIKDHGLIRVGGDGKCGANCISTHTTGNENLATEIRTNINRHILENWEVYQDSFELPHTTRVGTGTKTFPNQEAFMIFLMEEEEEASTMWMTHVCLQAASTMLNMHIKILTTGITTPQTFKCARCNTGQEFRNKIDILSHDENTHNRKETEEEKEGRMQKHRWTNIKPDSRLRELGQNQKAEDLTLLH